MEYKVEFKMKKTVSSIGILKSLLLAATMTVGANAQAALVQFTINGEITSATTDNIFDVSVFDTVTAYGQFDDSLIGTGESTINFSNAVNSMEIAIGNTTFTDSMDLLGGADMYFLDGVFDGIDYEAIDGTFDSWGYAGLIDVDGFILDDFNGVGIGGSWNVSSFAVTPVPVPAALWLFVSGLFILIKFSKRP